MAIKTLGSNVINDDRTFNIKTGTTSQRPTSPIDGVLWYNSELNTAERYNSTGSWDSLDTALLTGQANYFSKDPGSGWVLANNSIALQSTYPNVFNMVGILPTNSPPAWTQRTGTAARSMAYGNGLFVYGGPTGKVGTSTDGITWTVGTSGTTSTIYSVTYGNGLYVYGGHSGRIATSTDGLTWTARTSNTTESITALTYFNGLFVYGGTTAFQTSGGGAIGTSTDGITWTLRTSNTTTGISSLIYGGGLFMYGGQQGAIATSTDAITWTVKTSNLSTTGSSPISSLAYGNGVYIATNDYQGMFTTTDLITWTQRDTAAGMTYSADTVAYGAGLFVAFGVSGPGAFSAYSTMTAYSNDGVTWTVRTEAGWDSSQSGASLIYGEGIFVNFYRAGSNGVQTAAVLNYDVDTEFLIPGYPPIITGLTDDSNYFKLYLKN